MSVQPVTTTVVTTLLECAQNKASPVANFTLAENVVDSEIIRLNADASYADSLLYLLFPNGYPSSSATLDKLFDFANRVTEFSSAEKIAKCLLTHLFSMAESNCTQSILSSILEKDNAHFWQNMRLLTTCLSNQILPADFLANWFLGCAEREGNDLAGGQAFELAQAYAEMHPDISMQIIRLYTLSDLSGDLMTLAYVMLGSLRSSSRLIGPLSQQLCELELELSTSIRTDYRVCFHRSWIITFRKQPFDAERLSQRLTVMLAGTEEEVTSAFLVLSRCAYYFADKDTALSFAIDWLSVNTNSRISTEAKHHVAWLLHGLITFDRIKPTSAIVEKLLKISLLISPVPLENKGTWELLLTFSIRCIPHCTPAGFTTYWISLVQQSPDKLLTEGFNHNDDRMFWYHLKESCNAEVVTRLMFSRDHLGRRYGRLFFDKLDNISTFIPEVIDECSERLLLITLLEYFRSLREGPLLLRFFLAIAPRMAKCEVELTKRFQHEVFRQIVNLPGSLMESLALASKDYPVFSDPVKSAKSYFEKLKNLHDIPVNYFHKHEIDSSVRLFNRKFSAAVQKGVAENSFLMAIAGKPVRVLYGASFANAFGGRLSDSTNFHQFSHSSEWPRLTCIDPDGEALVGIQYLQEIERLSKDEFKSEH